MDYGELKPEGKQYEYMKDDDARIKACNGRDIFWWTRSGCIYTHKSHFIARFCGVTTDDKHGADGASGKYGIAPAFCL